jgi:lysophospholipase L1-like esterase
MAYTRQEFIDNKTKLTAEHLKNIENGIIDNEVTFVAGEGITIQDSRPSIISYKINTNLGADGKIFASWSGRMTMEKFFETNGQTPTVVYNNSNLGSLSFAYRYYTSDKVTIASSVDTSVYCRIIIVTEGSSTSSTSGTTIQDESVINTIFTVNNIAYQFNNDSATEPSRTVSISNTGGVSGNSLEYDDYVMQIFEKIACIGDSLTAGYTNKNGELFGSNVAREAKRNWPTYLGKRLGSEIVNLGYGSTSTHSWRYNDDNLGADITQAEVSDIQCYCIGLGANDLRQNKTIGSTSDIKSDYNQNNDTCYGNYHYIVSRLLAFNPNAHIFCFTVPNCENKYDKFNPVVRHICSLYAGKRVHLIDLEKLYPTEYKAAMFNTCNNGHFTPLIYNIMSVYIQKAISDYMVNNYTQFYGAPYNGK